MIEQRRAQQSGIHRSIRFLITEADGTWQYSFSIGGRSYAGKITAVLGLLAARRVKMKIDRVLRQEASRLAHADAEPGRARNPGSSAPVERSAAATTVRDGSALASQDGETTNTVAFVCEVCNVVFEAVQVCVAAKGLFRCDACGWPVHQWEGAYDYRDWRRLDNAVETDPGPPPQ